MNAALWNRTLTLHINKHTFFQAYALGKKYDLFLCTLLAFRYKHLDHDLAHDPFTLQPNTAGRSTLRQPVYQHPMRYLSVAKSSYGSGAIKSFTSVVTFERRAESYIVPT